VHQWFKRSTRGKKRVIRENNNKKNKNNSNSNN
jgi:hypothetical protein